MGPTTPDAGAPRCEAPPAGGAKQGCRANLTRLVWFTVTIAILSAVAGSLLALWIPLPWWKIFRRCVSLSALFTLWFFMRHLDRQPFRTLGLGAWAEGRRQVVRGVLIGLSVAVLVGTLYLGLGWWRVSLYPDSRRFWSTLLASVPAMGLVAVLEELIFRGYVLRQLLACSRTLALAGTSAAYALVHLRTAPVWPSSGLELVGLFILGWVLALSVLRTKQLYLAIGLHASLAYWARVNKFLVEFTTPSLQWLVGTSRLVNGVAVWCVLAGVGWVMTRRTRISA